MKICRISAIKSMREMMAASFNQGGTAGTPVPIGIGIPAVFVMRSNEPKSVLARDIGDCRDNE